MMADLETPFGPRTDLWLGGPPLLLASNNFPSSMALLSAVCFRGAVVSGKRKLEELGLRW